MKSYEEKKKELKRRYREELEKLESQYISSKNKAEELGSHVLIWTKDRSTTRYNHRIPEMIVLASVDDIIFNKKDEMEVKSDSAFCIRIEEQEAYNHEIYSKYIRKKYTDISINTDIVKPIKEELVDELVEFLYIDSGEKYLMMHEKFLAIRKRLSEEGFEPIVD